MGYAIGTLLKGGGADVNKQIITTIKTLAEANGWTTLRYVDTGDNWEWIGQGEGLSTTEEIFIGFRSYFSSGADYYNLDVAVFTGYVAGNSFATQPGKQAYAVPCHNNAVDYFIQANPQRIVGCFKVGTPVYEHFYVGKYLPYSRPDEYPYPVAVGGMTAESGAMRFSDTNQQFPYYGWWGFTSAATYSLLAIRPQGGIWARAACDPYSAGSSRNTSIANAGSGSAAQCIRDTGGYYPLIPITMYAIVDTVGPSVIYGELDGVYFVSGFNNSTENVIQVGGNSVVDQTGMTVAQAVAAILAVSGRALVVLQDVYRTGFNNHIALEMK